MTWFELLKRYRLKAGYSQEALAEKSGMSRNGISDLERGRRTQPRRDSLLLLTEALGLDDAQTHEVLAAAGEVRAGLPVPEVRERSRLVGRDEELTLAQGLLDRPESACLWVSGEPGIGKSRLGREVSALARARGWQVLTGASHRWSASLPFAPVIEPIDRYRKSLEAPDDIAFTEAYPVLAKALSLGSGPDHPDRALLFAQIAAFLEDPDSHGVLLWLDDLQWAGEDAVALLSFFLRRSWKTPLFLLLCFRSTELETHSPLERLFYDSLKGDRRHHRELPPLTWPEAWTILGDTDRAAPLSRPKALEAFEHSKGNPYLLECFADAQEFDLGRPPDSVQSFLLGLLADLSAPSRAVLEYLAVSAHPLPLRLLDRMLSQVHGKGAALDSLDALVRRRLVVETEPGRFSFVHDRMRTVVDSTLSAAKRPLMCHRLAEALEESEGPVDRNWLADLYDQAQDHPRAAAYALSAGREALARAGYHKAVYSLGRARELGRLADRPDLVLQASLVLVDALIYQGGYERARDLASSLLRQREDLTETEWLHLVISSIQSHYRHGQSGEALEVARTWAAEVGRLKPSVDAVQFFVLQGLMGFLEGDAETYAAALDRAEDARAVVQDRRADLLVLESRALVLTTKGLNHEAQQLFAGHDLSLRGLDPRLWLQVIVQHLASEFSQGHYEPADLGRRIAEAQRVATDLQDGLLMSFTGALVVNFAYERGDWAQVLEQGEWLEVASRSVPGMVFLPLVLVHLVVVTLWQGKEGQARHWETLYRASPGVRTNSALLLASVRAEIALLKGNRVDEEFLSSLGPTEEAFYPDTDSDWHCLSSLVGLLEGRPGPHWERLATSLAKERERGNLVDYYLALQYQVWARINNFSGEEVEERLIEAELNEGLVWTQRQGLSFLGAKFRLLQGRLEAKRGRGQEAKQALDAVVAWSDAQSEAQLRAAALRLASAPSLHSLDRLA